MTLNPVRISYKGHKNIGGSFKQVVVLAPASIKIEIHYGLRLVISRLFDIRGNLGNAKEILPFTDRRNPTILVYYGL